MRLAMQCRCTLNSQCHLLQANPMQAAWVRMCRTDTTWALGMPLRHAGASPSCSLAGWLRCQKMTGEQLSADALTSLRTCMAPRMRHLELPPHIARQRRCGESVQGAASEPVADRWVGGVLSCSAIHRVGP